MNRRTLAAVASLALLAGCASQSAVTTMMASYTLADTAIASYNAQPGANPTTVKALRDCENTAWTVVKPVSDALIAQQSPTTALVDNAMTAVTDLQTCLTSLGVKIP